MEHVKRAIGEINAQIQTLMQAKLLLEELYSGYGTPPPTDDIPPPKKRVMSAAGRKRIAEAVRKRWAAKKAANALTLPKKMGRPRKGIGAGA